HNSHPCTLTTKLRPAVDTAIPYESTILAQENAAMNAYMVCRAFSVNGGMLARHGIIQGLP
ncbi:uncharacterized protein B0I36DRAFT_222545, partial [Microdochium trichocladiopsis]